MTYRFSSNKRWELFWKCIDYTFKALLGILILVNLFDLVTYFFNK